MESLEALFQQTASRINLNKTITRNAWETYTHVYSVDEQLYKRNPTEWFVAHIYLALLEQTTTSHHLTSQSTRVTVTLLLNVSKMHCEEFLKKLKLTLEHMLASPLISTIVDDLIRNYVITAAVYDKCSRIFSEVFVEEADAVGYIEPNYHKLVSEQKKMVWLLYLLAREKTSFDTKELTIAFYVQLCCFVPVIKSTPTFLLKPHWGILTQSSEQILQKLCEDYSADWVEVYRLIFQSKDWSDFSAKYETLSLHAAVKDWHTLQRSLRIDDLDFIDAPELMVPTKIAGGESNSTQVQPTPVQYRLNTIQHLKSMVIDVSDSPSDTLRQFFQQCEDNPEERIMLRLNELRDRYVNAYLAQHQIHPTGSTNDHKQNEIPVHRFALIRRLYLHVLETMLQQEGERLSRTDFSTLLHIDTFHRSLVTCCALVVNHTYNEHINSSDGLESMLDTFNIEAYHMCKVIESFIKAEPELSKRSVEHLKLCENHILDNLAWRSNSSLYDVLPSVDLASNQSDPIAPVLPNDKGASGAAQFLTPTCRRVQDGPFIENGHLPRSHSLSMFMNKVCRLAYHRLQLLCNWLTIPNDLVPKIWTCLEFCIRYRHDLLRNRHLDQIIMCSLYAICRVIDKEVKFKVIVSGYAKLLHKTDSSIYKHVVMASPSSTGSIVAFYNEVYMQSMKAYLLKFSPDRCPPSSPAPRIGHSPHKISPVRISQNVTVSPLKLDTTKRLLMTPRSGRLYCFNGTEGFQQLQPVHNSVIHPPASVATTKRLRFDEPSTNSWST